MNLKGKQGTSCLFVCVLRKMMKEEIYIQVRALMYIQKGVRIYPQHRTVP